MLQSFTTLVARSEIGTQFVEVNNYDSSPHPLASSTLVRAATKIHSSSSDLNRHIFKPNPTSLQRHYHPQRRCSPDQKCCKQRLSLVLDPGHI